ncbi:MAG: phage/plasmid primase, P4 family [Staphylococcus equorum]|nr:phage/plasmid primase, P4 family [Staphylococcus equorum]
MVDLFPKELTKLNNWCVWRLIKRGGKDTKLPFNAKTGELAKSNDPSTWTSFDEAQAVLSEGNADGLGFFFEPPYVGIDVDDIADELERYKNGDIEKNIVFEMYELLKTYAEISPSGNGIHLILKGEIPGDQRRRKNVEMYSEGRFFTMTGNSLNKYHEINEPSKNALDLIYRKYIRSNNVMELRNREHGVQHNLSDAEVVNRAIESQQGGKFKDLLNGNFSHYSEYPSQSEADIAFVNMLAFWTARDYQQIDRIYRQSGLMRQKWDEKRGKTTYGAGLINKTINEVADVYTPSTKREPLKYNFGEQFNNTNQKKKKKYPNRSTDDTGNAQRFLDRFGDIVRFSYNRDKFYIYNGQKWEIDSSGQIRVLIDKTIEDMENEKVFVAEGVEEEDAMAAFQKHIKSSRNNSAKKRMLDEIKHHIPILPEEFDPDSMLLNTLNGFIDLSTGEQREPDKDKMFSMITEAELTNSQQADTWNDFLKDIFDHDKEVIEFIQRAVGYSLTASTREQVMFILHGKGRNGKSLFIETIRTIMGSYTDNIQAKTLMVKRGETINNDIAKLQGVRLVTSSEPSEGFRFDEGLIKQLTGGDTVTARFLYGEEFNFDPKFKIWVTTNHKPLVRGTDDGIWRRLILIPFDVQIPENKVDKDLKYKLLREAPAILNWAVEGCLKWQESGLKIPSKIANASEGYRKEMDVLEQFVADECIVNENERVAAGEIFKAYKKWAEETGAYYMNKNKFGIKMKEKFESIKSGNIYYVGVNLKQKFPGLSAMK